MTSYRTSHVGEDCGIQYDATHAGKVDSYVWDTFIKDYLDKLFDTCVENGANNYLDFACGTGRVLKLGSKHFRNYTGIDISIDMLEVARNRVPNARIICGDVTTNPSLSTQQYDCVSLFRFLLNAERPLCIEVLRWLAAHMPLGGRLIGNNHMNLASFRGVATLASNTFFYTARNYLSRKATIEMLEETGFRIVEWSGYRVLPTVKGKPIFGKAGQMALEQMARAFMLGRLGSEQIFVAKKFDDV